MGKEDNVETVSLVAIMVITTEKEVHKGFLIREIKSVSHVIAHNHQNFDLMLSQLS